MTLFQDEAKSFDATFAKIGEEFREGERVRGSR